MAYDWRDNVNDNDSIMPMSKEDVLKEKKGSIPSVIFKAVNKLLVKNPIRSGKITIDQDDILKIVCGDTDCGGLDRNAVFDNDWLDFEDFYREVGWRVTYVKPSYGDNFKPYFIFE